LRRIFSHSCSTARVVLVVLGTCFCLAKSKDLLYSLLTRKACCAHAFICIYSVDELHGVCSRLTVLRIVRTRDCLGAFLDSDIADCTAIASDCCSYKEIVLADVWKAKSRQRPFALDLAQRANREYLRM